MTIVSSGMIGTTSIKRSWFEESAKIFLTGSLIIVGTFSIRIRHDGRGNETLFRYTDEKQTDLEEVELGIGERVNSS